MTRDACPISVGRFVGEYRVVELIGSGGMGWVLAAVHPVIEKKAAIKLLKPALAEDSEAMERFVAEAKAVNRIGHPNIVDIFSFGHTDSGIPFFVMEYLNAGSLRRLLKQGWRPAPREAVSLLDGVLSALQAAHERGIVHRDLKPDNICLHDTPDGLVAKLVDFGVAKFVESGIKTGTTRSGVPIGTPTYMAPEQCRGRKVDARADIYAMGVILYELFSGRVPFASDSYLEVLLAHVEEAPEPLGRLVDVDPAVEGLVMACLAKQPDDRPQTVRELRHLLRSAVGLRQRSRVSLPEVPGRDSLSGTRKEVVSAPTMESPSALSARPGPAPDPALSPTVTPDDLRRLDSLDLPSKSAPRPADSQRTWDVEEEREDRRRRIWRVGAAAAAVGAILVVSYWSPWRRREDRPKAGKATPAARRAPRSAFRERKRIQALRPPGPRARAEAPAAPRKSPTPAGTGPSLRVESEPPGARILVAGRPCGRSPVDCPLPGKGRMTVRAEKKGWRAAEQRVDPSRTKHVVLRLRRLRRSPRRSRPRTRNIGGGFVVNP